MVSLIASASTVPAGYSSTTVSGATPGLEVTGVYALSVFVASHVGGGLNIGGQTVAHKLRVIRTGVDTVLATVTLAANATTQGSASFSYTTQQFDLLYMSATPSGLLTVGVTTIEGGVS